MEVRKETNKIVLHHTLTTYDVGVKQIREWHKAKGWEDIGYNYIIRKDGTIEEGRELKYQGAHAKGRNADSIGICIVGDHSKQIPLPAQLQAVNELITLLIELYDMDTDQGWYDIVEMHRDLEETNPCPGKNFQELFWSNIY